MKYKWGVDTKVIFLPLAFKCIIFNCWKYKEVRTFWLSICQILAKSLKLIIVINYGINKHVAGKMSRLNISDVANTKLLDVKRSKDLIF